MRKHTILIYEFDELPEDVQSSLIENCDLTHIFEEDASFYLDNKAEELEEIYKGIKISYNGFWSQGDGASFTCDNVNILELVTEEAIRQNVKHGKLLSNEAIKTILDDVEASISRVNYRYYHPYSVRINCDYNGNISRIGQEIANYLQGVIEKEEVKISNSIYKDLEKIYDETHEEENVKEYLRFFEYYEDGRRFLEWYTRR